MVVSLHGCFVCSEIHVGEGSGEHLKERLLEHVGEDPESTALGHNQAQK